MPRQVTAAVAPGGGAAIAPHGGFAAGGAHAVQAAPAVQREVQPSPAVPVPLPATEAVAGETVRRFTTPPAAPPPVLATNGTDQGASGSAGTSATEDALSTTALLDRVDEMMGQLEERILEELERRGGRFTGYF